MPLMDRRSPDLSMERSGGRGGRARVPASGACGGAHSRLLQCRVRTRRLARRSKENRLSYSPAAICTAGPPSERMIHGTVSMWPTTRAVSPGHLLIFATSVPVREAGTTTGVSFRTRASGPAVSCVRRYSVVKIAEISDSPSNSAIISARALPTLDRDGSTDTSIRDCPSSRSAWRTSRTFFILQRYQALATEWVAGPSLQGRLTSRLVTRLLSSTTRGRPLMRRIRQAHSDVLVVRLFPSSIPDGDRPPLAGRGPGYSLRQNQPR